MSSFTMFSIELQLRRRFEILSFDLLFHKVCFSILVWIFEEMRFDIFEASEEDGGGRGRSRSRSRSRPGPHYDGASKLEEKPKH